MVGTPSELDRVLDVCEHKYRRIVLAVLTDQQQSVAINHLTKAIVKRTTGETETEIQTALHHVHLPKLADVGFIKYDSERQLTEPTAQFNQGVPHLSALLGADAELAVPLGV